MKRAEFANEVLLDGFLIDVGRYNITVKDEYGAVLFKVSELTRYRLSNFFQQFKELDDDEQEKLFYLAAHYASTPIDER